MSCLSDAFKEKNNKETYFSRQKLNCHLIAESKVNINSSVVNWNFHLLHMSPFLNEKTNFCDIDSKQNPPKQFFCSKIILICMWNVFFLSSFIHLVHHFSSSSFMPLANSRRWDITTPFHLSIMVLSDIQGKIVQWLAGCFCTRYDPLLCEVNLFLTF